MTVTKRDLVHSLAQTTGKLSPKERARYVSDQKWRAILQELTGKDSSTIDADLNEFQRNHVSTLRAEEYISFLEALYWFDLEGLNNVWKDDHHAGICREFLLLRDLIQALEVIVAHSKSPNEYSRIDLKKIKDIENDLIEHKRRYEVIREKIFGPIESLDGHMVSSK